MAAFEDAVAWAAELERLGARIAPRFGRVEPRRRALAYLRGLLAPIERKNGWQLAEAAGDATPDGMQDFLGRMRWDADRVRDDLRAYVVEHLPGRSGGGAGVGWLNGAAVQRFREEGHAFGRRAAAVFRHRGPNRELPDRGVPRLRRCEGTGADRPRALPARALGRRRRAVREGRCAGRGRVRDQAQARRGHADAGAGGGRAVRPRLPSAAASAKTDRPRADG